MLTSVEWFQLLIIKIKFHLFPITVAVFRGRPNVLYFLTFCLVFVIITQALCVYGRLIDLSGVFCVHRFKSLVTFFPAFPVGNIKRFFLQKTIFS